MGRFISVCKNALQKEYSEHKQGIFICLCSVFAFGMIAHAYGFLNCNPSHDMLNAFAATSMEEAWKIELGRIFVPVYRAIFRGPIVLPWLIGLLGLFWTAIASYIVIRIFKVCSRILTVLICGIMVTNITWIAQIATYIYEFDFNAFALMLSVSAAAFWRGGSFLKTILGAVCLMLSIGIYQSYISVTITIIICLSIMDLFNGTKTKTVFHHGLRGIGMIVLSCLLYFVICKAVYAITGIAQNPRTNVASVPSGVHPVYGELPLVLFAILHLIENIVHPVYGKYILPITVAVITAFLASLAIYTSFRKAFPASMKLLIWLLIVILPFGMTSIFILARGNNVHALMIYAYWFFDIFVLLRSVRFCENDMVPCKLTSAAKIIACALAIFMIWQNIVIANTAYIKKERESEATLSTMTRVVDMIEEHEEYEFKKTEVAFIGTNNTYGNIPEFDYIRSITGLRPNNSIAYDDSLYYYNSYDAYFKYVLNYPITLCDDETHSKLEANEKVQSMPSFPDRDCIAVIDDVLVVKMGNY